MNKEFALALILSMCMNYACKRPTIIDSESKDLNNSDPKMSQFPHQTSPTNTQSGKNQIPISSAPLTAPKGFLPFEDLELTSNFEELNRKSLRKELNKQSAFFSNPQLADTFTSEQECLTQKLEETLIEATDATLKFEANLDLIDCPSTGDAAKLKSNRVRVLYFLSCNSADFREWNAKAASVFVKKSPSIDSFCKAGEGYYLLNTKINRAFENDLAQGKTDLVVSTHMRGLMTKTGEGCKFSIQEKIRSFDDGCLQFDSNLTVQSSGKTANLFLAISRGLKSELGDKYFSSGTMDITLNNWQGSVTFGGSNIAPTYKLTSSIGKDEGKLTTPAASRPTQN